MSHPTNNNRGVVVPPSLVEQMAAARLKQAEERAKELDPSRERPDPAFDVNQRPIAPKPLGIAASRIIVGRPPGVALGGAVRDASNRDDLGAVEPRIADLREHLARGDEQ